MTGTLNWGSFLAIGLGAVLGAWLRWGLSQAFNALWPQLPPGTLLANLAGAYLIGLALGWFALDPGVSPQLRLLLVTGFLGSFTTFSAFSAEAVGLLSRQQYGWAAAHITMHVGGCLLATALGFATLKVARVLP